MDYKKLKDNKAIESHWIQLYLQAKQDGNTKMIKIYKDILNKLKIKIPRL